MGGSLPKPYLPLGGVPIVVRTARRLGRALPGAGLVLVVHPEDRSGPLREIESELARAGVTSFVDGGETRQASVLAGVGACPRAEVVLVHDAVRPFFPQDATRQLARLARERGAAILATHARDTLKEVGGDQRIVRTIARETVWQAQTPQAFRRGVLLEALRRAQAEGFAGTDDASVVERAGHPVFVVPGAQTNLKITTPEDLALAEEILRRMEEEDR
jgi:2-C-methyl-D-erythritol 4-phosphate cytidylyltransferase